MPYRKQKQRVLAGSLNLLPPGDITPPPDSLALTNWRVDQAGCLRSRKGMNQLVAGLGATVHSLYRKGENRYAGVGNNLRYGTCLGMDLGGGFDGQPVGMVAHGDFVWVMNPARQLKLFGPEVRNWGIAAPASAPTVTAGSQVTTPVVGFHTGEAWTLRRWIGGVCTENPKGEKWYYNAGTVACTQGSVDILGTGVDWQADSRGASFYVGKNIRIHAVDAAGNPYPAVHQIAAVWGASHLTLTKDFEPESGSGYEYEIYDPAVESKQFLTVGGETFLQLTCSPVGRWQLQHVFTSPKNLCISTPGNEQDDDQFRFWIWCEDASAIDSLKVTLLAGDRAVTCSVPLASLNPAAYTWNEISISRRFDPQRIVEANPEYQNLLLSMVEAEEIGNTVWWEALNQRKAELYNEVVARTPHFTNLTTPEGSIYDFNWSAVTEAWFAVENNVPTVVNFNDASMVGGPDNTMEGEWRFAYTYANIDAFGHESNPSDWSAPVTLQKQAPTVVMAGSTDSQVTQCHVYGIGGVLQEPLRFGTRHANGGTLTVDKIHGCFTVEEAQTAYIPIPDDHDPPPAARGIAGPYFGRILAWSGNRLYWSKVAQPAYWPGADDPAEGNWEDVGENNDDILNVTCHKRLAIVYKQRSIWRYPGDPDTTSPEQTNANVGLLGQPGIVNAGAVDYFAAAEGIYRFNGDFEEKISVKVDPIFKGDWVTLADGCSAAPITSQFASQSVMAFINGRLYFSYPDSVGNLPTKTLVYDVDSQRWYMDSRGFTAILYEGQGQHFVGAACIEGSAPWGANLQELERESTDAGAAIPVVWQSAFSDQGLPDNPKVYCDLVIDHKCAQLITVKMIYDNRTVENVGSLYGPTRQSKVFPLGPDSKGRRARNAAVRIEGNLTSEAVIYGVYLHWYAEARRGKTYDSEIGDDGTQQAKLYCEMEFELESDGAVTWELHTDVPGGLVAPRASGSVPAAGGRKTVPVTLPANVWGWRRRLYCYSDQEFQVHRLRLRVLPVGEYIDGAQGDTWESQPV